MTISFMDDQKQWNFNIWKLMIMECGGSLGKFWEDHQLLGGIRIWFSGMTLRTMGHYMFWLGEQNDLKRFLVPQSFGDTDHVEESGEGLCSMQSCGVEVILRRRKTQLLLFCCVCFIPTAPEITYLCLTYFFKVLVYLFMYLDALGLSCGIAGLVVPQHVES